MSLEQAINDNTAALKALVVAIGSAFAAGAMATATPANDTAAPAPAPKADKAEKKVEKKVEEAKPAAVTWKQALEAVKEVNTKVGRDGVTTIIEKFGKAGDKVPALEAVNKHAEILAFAQSLLNPAADEAPGDDDLGI